MESLTFENLKILSSSNQSSQKAKILVDVISSEYLRNSDDLYKINKENQTLELVEKSRAQNVIIKVIQDMYFHADEKLSDDQKTILKTKDFMNYSKYPISIQSNLSSKISTNYYLKILMITTQIKFISKMDISKSQLGNYIRERNQ
jgi:hypothetical protein